MNFTALLLSLGLMGTVYSSPLCDPGCKPATGKCSLDFKHVSELEHSSVAPWNISKNTEADRLPEHIDYADCKDCTVKHMVAKPIFLQIFVYRKRDNNEWCKCPFDLAVGCTCVKE
ncbi:interleukin-17A-like [Lycodopsis pacificus]